MSVLTLCGDRSNELNGIILVEEQARAWHVLYLWPV
jgi:hypothetical protein